MEYTLYSIFFIKSFDNKLIKKCIQYSIPIFILLSLYLSIGIFGLSSFVGFNDNLEGILLIVWSIVLILNLPFNYEYGIHKNPYFYVCLALITFHSGIFFFNFVYSKLYLNDKENAENLFQIIIKGLNYILYILFSIAILCWNPRKKFTLL